MKTNRSFARVRSSIALSAVLLGGCGGVPGGNLDIDLSLLGTWTRTDNIGTQEMSFDAVGGYKEETTLMFGSDGSMAGCVGHRKVEARYSAGDGGEPLLDVTGAKGTASITDCADPAKNEAEHPLEAMFVAGVNRQWTYKISGNTLTLTYSKVTLSYTRK